MLISQYLTDPHASKVNPSKCYLIFHRYSNNPPLGGVSGINCMWGWFTGWGKTSPVSRRLFFTASAMASAIPCRAPSGTLARCWLAVPPADEVEAISWPVLAGTWRSVAGCCVFSAVSAAPRLRLECKICVADCWPLSFWQHSGRG